MTVGTTDINKLLRAWFALGCDDLWEFRELVDGSIAIESAMDGEDVATVEGIKAALAWCIGEMLA